MPDIAPLAHRVSRSFRVSVWPVLKPLNTPADDGFDTLNRDE